MAGSIFTDVTVLLWLHLFPVSFLVLWLMFKLQPEMTGRNWPM